MKFPIPEKFVNLMKDQKYEHQIIFPFWEGSNLILGISMENQIFFLRTPAAVKFFTKLSKNDTLASLEASQGVSDAPHDGGCPLMPPVMEGGNGCPP